MCNNWLLSNLEFILTNFKIEDNSSCADLGHDLDPGEASAPVSFDFF